MSLENGNGENGSLISPTLSIVGSEFSSFGRVKKWMDESKVTILIHVRSGYKKLSRHDLIDDRVWCKKPLSKACKEVSMANTKL